MRLDWRLNQTKSCYPKRSRRVGRAAVVQLEVGLLLLRCHGQVLTTAMRARRLPMTQANAREDRARKIPKLDLKEEQQRSE